MKFDITEYLKLVFPFQEADADRCFLHFERVAGSLKWPKDYRVIQLQSVPVGMARKIYTKLCVQQAANYDTVYGIILKGSEIVSESQRP